jgi:AP-3 complex subunit delta-1
LEDPLATLQSMLRSQASSLPGHIQAVYVHNILKLAATTFVKAEKEGNIETMETVYKAYNIIYDSNKFFKIFLCKFF